MQQATSRLPTSGLTGIGSLANTNEAELQAGDVDGAFNHRTVLEELSVRLRRPFLLTKLLILKHIWCLLVFGGKKSYHIFIKSVKLIETLQNFFFSSFLNLQHFPVGFEKSVGVHDLELGSICSLVCFISITIRISVLVAKHLNV